MTPDNGPMTRGEMASLHPSIQTVWRITGGLWWGLLVLAVLAYDLVNVFRVERVLPFGVLTLGVLVVAVLYLYLVPRLRYRAWRYALESEELYVERGLINRIRTIVPLRRIQHLDVSQNIIEREYELGKLIVHTAGTRDSTVTVPGLPLPEAEALRDRVKAYLLEDPL